MWYDQTDKKDQDAKINKSLIISDNFMMRLVQYVNFLWIDSPKPLYYIHYINCFINYY